MDQSWNFYFTIIITIAFAVLIWLLFRTKENKKEKYSAGMILRVIMGAVFFMSVIYFLPINLELYPGEKFQILKVVLLSIMDSMGLFVVNGDYSQIREMQEVLTSGFYTRYSILGAVLFVIAPALTFGAVIMIFKSTLAKLFLRIGKNKKTYVFSELNDISFQIAQDISNNHKKCRIIFANVSEEDGHSLKESNVYYFEDNLDTLHDNLKQIKNDLYLFVFGEDSALTALSLIEQYKDRDNTFIYVFDETEQGKIILESADYGRTKIKRINPARELVNQLLYQSGHELFEKAISRKENKYKLIHVLLIGLDSYGQNMLKALAWYCQMTGYELNIDAYDNNGVEDEIYAKCPELLDSAHNGVYVKGEPYYRININSKINIYSTEFREKMKNMDPVSYVFVSKEDDRHTIEAAAYIRQLMEQQMMKPQIKAVVHNPKKHQALSNMKIYSGKTYDIDFIGNDKNVYTEKVILGSNLEHIALQRHLKWGDEASFWRYEYNYRSSVASAIHLEARKRCGLQAEGKKEEDYTPEEILKLSELEHKRWNAYMRSEGYIYSGDLKKTSRNDLGKMHHNLVPFQELSESDQRKDVNEILS